MTTYDPSNDVEIVEPSVAAVARRDTPKPVSALVTPAAGLATIAHTFSQYRELQGRILDGDDFQEIAGRRFPKKSAWRKLAVAFGVSFQIVERSYDRDPDGRIVRAEFVTRAVAPNGRYADGWGACDVFERCCPSGCRRNHRHCPAQKGERCPGAQHFSHAEHDVPATAETRSKNRAASDLFGLGEVSAEEIVGDQDHPARAPVDGFKSFEEEAEANRNVRRAITALPTEARAEIKGFLDDHQMAWSDPWPRGFCVIVGDLVVERLATADEQDAEDDTVADADPGSPENT